MVPIAIAVHPQGSFPGSIVPPRIKKIAGFGIAAVVEQMHGLVRADYYLRLQTTFWCAFDRNTWTGDGRPRKEPKRYRDFHVNAA
jgi:hypothetical protein